MARKVKEIEGSVCAPKGFKAAALACGIKNPAVERLDLALIYSEFPTVGSAVYTQNQVCAAPVRLSASHLKSAEPRAIIANSGNANACTGPDGLINARAMSSATAKALGLRQREVQVCSTGIIGVPLPIQELRTLAVSHAHRRIAKIQELRRANGPASQAASQAASQDSASSSEDSAPSSNA